VSDSPEGTRLSLARRRLLLAFDKRGEPLAADTQLEGAVKAAAQIIEREPRDLLPDCDSDPSREHWWTEWRLNPLGLQREERFCFECGSMESQELL
jgi:hypothetical protein